MFSAPLNLTRLHPKLKWLNQIRHRRPILRISKDKFQLSLDLGQFCKDEIRVKARPEFLVIEGKHERQTGEGYVVRQFVRKFKIPEGTDIRKITSSFSPEGILTVSAPRNHCDINLPCETEVPINYGGPAEENVSLIQPKSGKDDKDDLCSHYLKPKDPLKK